MPYGYPLVCEVDADGAFEGEFRLKLEEAGVHLVVIPPEAHWRIGTVERKNAVLRTVVEKLLDENAVVSGDGLDWVLMQHFKHSIPPQRQKAEAHIKQFLAAFHVFQVI